MTDKNHTQMQYSAYTYITHKHINITANCINQRHNSTYCRNEYQRPTYM